jgi:hypothetical protein
VRVSTRRVADRHTTRLNLCLWWQDFMGEVTSHALFQSSVELVIPSAWPWRLDDVRFPTVQVGKIVHADDEPLNKEIVCNRSINNHFWRQSSAAFQVCSRNSIWRQSGPSKAFLANPPPSFCPRFQTNSTAHSLSQSMTTAE